MEALVEDEPYVVTVTARGYVRAVPGAGPRRESAVDRRARRGAQVIETSARAGVLFFTDRGRAYRATVHDLPKERLTAAQNLFQFGDGERLVAILDAPDAGRAPEPRVRDRERRGEALRRSASSSTSSGRKDGIVAMKLTGDDRVVAAFPGWDDYELLIVTAQGQGIRFAGRRSARRSAAARARSVASG